MHRKFLPLTLVLAVLMELIALLGFHALAKASPAIALADGEREKEVYLTFDDGPSTRVTGRILDILKKEGVPATFFIVSDRVPGREEVLSRIAAEGHTLGVHSTSHCYREIYASKEALLKDVEGCAAVIRRVTGVQPCVYRFPGGGPKNRETYKEILNERGYRVVSWNAVCGDEEIPNASPETLTQEAIRTSRGKRSVVLLLHDSAPHTATADALPAIIAHFRKEGYAFRRF